MAKEISDQNIAIDRLQSEGIARQDLEYLETYTWDHDAFFTLRAQLKKQSAQPSPIGHTANFEPSFEPSFEPKVPSPNDWQSWQSPNGPQNPKNHALGRQELKNRNIAMVILNGGMATRFGGCVKGLVSISQEITFLDAKIQQIRAYGQNIPIFLLNSFATHAQTQAHLATHHPQDANIYPLTQSISLRLTPKGDLFLAANKQPSFYAPGHGDIFATLLAHPHFQTFCEQGGHTVMASNVDNLGANPHPGILGLHIHQKTPVTVELAAKAPGDAGGLPAYIGKHLQIVEDFRFPPNFPKDAISVFNTNTLIFTPQAAAASANTLTWFQAQKMVDARPAIQFERLMGEITAYHLSHFIEVPRAGLDGRFFPIKTRKDLADAKPFLREKLDFDLRSPHR